MKKLSSCEFNMDTASVELKYNDGTLISIDCIALENQFARNMYEQSELDYLIYNDPVGHADLILNGDVEDYLRRVTDYRPLDERAQANRRSVVIEKHCACFFFHYAQIQSL